VPRDRISVLYFVSFMTGAMLHGVGSACVWSYKSQKKKNSLSPYECHKFEVILSSTIISQHSSYDCNGKAEKMCLPLSTSQNDPIGERGCNKESYGSPIVSSF